MISLILLIIDVRRAARQLFWVLRGKNAQWQVCECVYVLCMCVCDFPRLSVRVYVCMCVCAYVHVCVRCIGACLNRDPILPYSTTLLRTPLYCTTLTTLKCTISYRDVTYLTALYLTVTYCMGSLQGIMDGILSEMEATAQKHIVAESQKPSDDLQGI
jgi:hypothetical protein